MVQVQLWRSAKAGSRRRSDKPRRVPKAQQSVKALDRGLYELVERQFPDLWEDLEEAGRDMFVRGVLEAASHPLEDRAQALTVVIDTWREAQRLLYLPEDDEPYTDEERAEDDAALEALERGEGTPLDDLFGRDR